MIAIRIHELTTYHNPDKIISCYTVATITVVGGCVLWIATAIGKFGLRLYDCRNTIKSCWLVYMYS